MGTEGGGGGEGKKHHLLQKSEAGVVNKNLERAIETNQQKVREQKKSNRE